MVRLLVAPALCVVCGIIPGAVLPAKSAPAKAAATPARSVLATGPLQTAVVDVNPFRAPDAAVAFRRVRASGATAVRLIVFWKFLGLTGSERPPNFRANDPADPNYQWEAIDRQVRLAVANGLQPIVGIQLAPLWAERTSEGGDVGTRRPNPRDLADFARAAATRYSGRFQGLPRVRYWQAWNEPNYSGFLSPPSPAHYRQMVNAFSDAVHAVRRDNVVIAGGTSPFAFPRVAVGPQRFMRELLCMSAGKRPRPTCRAQIRFDVWAHHPYTTGGPQHKAQKADDVSLGDLPEMRDLLVAAIRAGHVKSRVKIRFWVTEFSWDSNPPDPVAVPTRLHARWVAEALYRMWQSGVSLVTWFQIKDDELSQTEWQSGLYYRSTDRPKLALTAFRFPFVAFSRKGGVDYWGRTPTSRATTVVVERQAGRRWQRVRTLRANRHGIFQGRAAGVRKGPLRARIAGKRDASLPFSLIRPRDRYFWPFGCGGILPCS